ncbi:hypothetical protein SYNPS1DRAFT_20672 [Syncephalis pseudoplumigaleata]|uniref:Pentacotripeptide-repeat region of PRORP domain-containing protein n=1 Tax=Syncephalis pseudoplumigaleata TaxID=1712513 RepID=A0A4P9Z864_9FUNG|nr:hypothetical protein SYNPS1DRAFT_20672 [Syncephalis pseudoplumigaleata]|eukprot:RKP27930.1 hypothetical protein SYNPS1DRAFT_20672 [Syncephalis pseudoplumigaleata]
MHTRGLKPPYGTYRALMRDAIWLTNGGHRAWLAPAGSIILRKELLRAHVTLFRLKRNVLREMLRESTDRIAYIYRQSYARTKQTLKTDMAATMDSLTARLSHQQVIRTAAGSFQRSLALLAYNDSIYHGHGIDATTERQLWRLIATRPSPYRDISLFVSMRRALLARPPPSAHADSSASNAGDATAQLVASSNLVAATQIVLSLYRDGMMLPIHLVNQLLSLLCEACLLKSARRSSGHCAQPPHLSTHPDIVSFNTVANAFVDQGNWEMVRYIAQMALDHGMRPTDITANIQFKAELMQQMEQEAATRPAMPASSPASSSMSLTVAEQVLNAWLFRQHAVEFRPNVSTYNICLRALLRKDSGLDPLAAGVAAHRIVRQMEAASIAPNLMTYNMLLQLYGRQRNRAAFAKVISAMIEHRLAPNRTTQSILSQYSNPSAWRSRRRPPGIA